MKPRRIFSTARLSFPLSFLLASAIAVLFTVQGIHAQTITRDAGGAAGSTAWYTNTNWNPDTASGAWTTANVAQFANAGTATTAGINMTTGSLSIGAIEVTSARTRALTIGSSATTGTLTLNGVTVNSVSNTILHSASNLQLTLQDNETGSPKTRNVALTNTIKEPGFYHTASHPFFGVHGFSPD